MMYTREATDEEIRIYNKVNEIVEQQLDDEQFEEFLDIVSERVFDWKHDKKVYNKAYRAAKKLGLTLAEVETWYCID